MNNKQLGVMWVGIIIIALMGLFPPFVEKSNSGEMIEYRFKGYHFFTTSVIDGRTYHYYRIYKIPNEFENLGNRFKEDEPITKRKYMELRTEYRRIETYGRVYRINIDYKRLYLQWIIVIIIFGALIVTIKFQENFFADVLFKTKKPASKAQDQKIE